MNILMFNYLPFVDNGMIKVFTVPVSVDMMRARKAIQNMLDNNNKMQFKYKIGSSNG